MKRIYLVKKDALLPNNSENWIIMNSCEFREFISSDEGQKRKHSFGRLTACSKDDAIIIAECGEETSREWKRESNRNNYRSHLEEDIETVPYLSDIDFYPEEASVEEIVVDKIMLELLKKNLVKIGLSDREMIRQLYLEEKQMSVLSYAKLHNVPPTTINYRVKRILNELRNYF